MAKSSCTIPQDADSSHTLQLLSTGRGLKKI